MTFDKTKPLKVKHADGGDFSDRTKVFPEGIIGRKPDGTLGTLAQHNRPGQPAPLLSDLNFGSSGQQLEFQVFEYDDPDRHILKCVT